MTIREPMRLFEINDLIEFYNEFCHAYDGSETTLDLGWALGVEAAADVLYEPDMVTRETCAIPIEMIPQDIFLELISRCKDIADYVEDYHARFNECVDDDYEIH